MPGQYSALPNEQEDIPVVQPGEFVRVTLTTGEVVIGEVVRVSNREMVVEQSGDYGSGSLTVQAADIQTIEVETFSHSEATVAKTAAIVVVVVMVGLVIFAYSLRGLGELN